MANASIGGLVSGLDTATIISQLMQVESQPQTLLKSRLSTQQSAVSALQSLNSKFANLVTKAADLAKANALSPVKATSSSTDVTVSADAGATAASLSFTVNKVATPTSVDYGPRQLTDAVTTDGSKKVFLDKLDGTALVEFDTGDGTVQGLVNAINASDKGLKATLVQASTGGYRLTIASTTTGTSSDFKLQDGSGNALAITGAVTDGQKAQIAVGTDTFIHDSNTFVDLMPGVDVTVRAVSTDPVTITVERDSKAASDSLKSLITAANEILAEIDKLTAYDAVTKKSGSLAGDSTLRALRSEVLETVSGVTSSDSVAFAGIQLDRYGKLTFDETKFASAYASGAGAVADKLGGFAARLKAVADGASNATNGTLTAAIKGRQSSVTDMQDAIESWDDRLALRRSALTRQFTALEVALGKLQGQSSWLAGQISSLPSMNK